MKTITPSPIHISCFKPERILGCVAAVFMAFTISACQSTGPVESVVQCNAPLPQRLELAISDVENRLTGDCLGQYDQYFEQLLAIGEGDPKPENKRLFSEFLSGMGRTGTISPRQSREVYTQYFGAKFVSSLSEFNTCSSICPIEEKVINDMRQELQDKTRGLLNIANDRAGYGRANKLHAELELSITAACLACASR